MVIWFITIICIISSLILLIKSKTKVETSLFFQFSFKPNIISPKSVFYTLSIINILLLIGTSIFWSFYKKYNESFNEKAPVWIRFGLNQFNLCTENVLAVWYSSMLMLFASIACFSCFILEKKSLTNKRSRGLTFGWLLLSIMFFGLSADEMGSWHESLLMIDFSRFLPGAWMNTLTIPIALVGLLMGAFFWLHVKSKPISFVLMIVGLILYLSNPFLERMEHILANEGLTQLNSLIWLEEGGEIFGTLSFLMATILYATNLKGFTTKVSVSYLTYPAIICGALITIGIWVSNIYPKYFPRGDVGIAQNWFPAMLSMIAGLVALNFMSQKRNFVYISTALFAILNSMYYGGNILGWIYGLDKHRTFVHSILLVLAAIAMIFLVKKINSTKYWIVFSLWIIIYTYTLNINPSYAQYTNALSAYLFLLLLLPLYQVPKVNSGYNGQQVITSNEGIP